MKRGVGIPGSVRGWYEIPVLETEEDSLRKRGEYLEAALRKIVAESSGPFPHVDDLWEIASGALEGTWTHEVEDTQ